MKKKSLLPIAAVGLAAIALTGCAGSGSSNPADITLRIGTSSGDEGALKAVTDAFTEETGIKVSIEPASDYVAALQPQIAAGTAPDVYFVYPGSSQPLSTTQLAESGNLADLSDSEWVSQLPESYASVIEGPDDKTYVAPVAVAGTNAIYNDDTLTKLGLSAPTTWSEVLEYCKSTQDQGVAAYALGIQTDWVNEILPYPLVATLVYSPGNTFDEDLAQGKTTFADSGWKQSLEMYQEMDDAGCFQSDPTGTSYDASLQMVADGTATGMVQVTSSLPGIVPLAPEGTSFSIRTFPATDDPSATMTVGAAASGYGVNSKAKNPDAAHQFIDFMMREDNMNAYAVGVAGVPGIPNDAFEVDATNQVLVDAQKNGTTVNYPDQLWPSGKVIDAINNGVQDMFNGNASPDDILAAMQSAYDAAK